MIIEEWDPIECRWVEVNDTEDAGMSAIDIAAESYRMAEMDMLRRLLDSKR